MQRFIAIFVALQLFILQTSTTLYAAEVVEEEAEFNFAANTVLTINSEEEEGAFCPAPNLNLAPGEFSSVNGNNECKKNLNTSITNESENEFFNNSEAIVGEELDTPPVCDDSFFQKEKISSKDKSNFQEHMQKLCYDQFKKHKRQFAKQLFKNGRVFKSLGVLLKRKKKYAKVRKHKLKKQSYSVEGEDLNELNKQIAEEEARIIQEFRNQVGGDLETTAHYFGEDNGKIFGSDYRYSLDGGSTIGDILIESPGGNCKMEIEDPGIEVPEVEYKSVLPPVDLLDSFPDACAYMVSEDFTEEQAMELMGVSSSNRSKVCSDRQVIDEKDFAKKDNKSNKSSFDYMNDIAQKVANSVEDGMKPNFTITVSRNMYADDVDDLAFKRGQFIQKYVYKKFLENIPEGMKLPKWASSPEEFNKVFKIEHPYYKEAATGDFGPNPLASSTDVDKEVSNLEQSLKVRSHKYAEDEKSYNQKFTNTKKEIEDLENKISDYQNKINRLENSLRTEKDLVKGKEIFEQVKELKGLKIQAQYSKKYKEYQLDEYQQMASYSKRKKNEFDPASNKTALKRFYDDRPDNLNEVFKKDASGKSYKENWDQRLFNKYKMASIEGTFEGGAGNDDEIEFDYLPPKLKYMISKSFQATGFQCSYKLDEIKKKTTKRKLKWPKPHWWKRNLMKPVVGITWTVATPFIGVIGLGKLIGKAFSRKNTCPDFSGGWHPYRKIARKMMPRGSGGGFKVNKRTSYESIKGGKYDGYQSDIWPEAEAAFKQKRK